MKPKTMKPLMMRLTPVPTEPQILKKMMRSFLDMFSMDKGNLIMNMMTRVSHFRKSCQMIMHNWDIVMHAILRSCAIFYFFSQSFWSPAKRFNFSRRNTKEIDIRRFFRLFDQKLIQKGA